MRKKTTTSHLIRSLNMEHCRQGIRFKILKPGFIATGLSRTAGEPPSRLNQLLFLPASCVNWHLPW